MTISNAKANALRAQYERDFTAEGRLIQRRLLQLAAELKLISVTSAGTEDDGGDGPLFLTLRIDPIPYSEAVKLYEPEADRGTDHLH